MRIHDELWDAIRDLVGPGWNNVAPREFFERSERLQRDFSLAEVRRAVYALGESLVRQCLNADDPDALAVGIEGAAETIHRWDPQLPSSNIDRAARALLRESDAFAGVPYNSMLFMQLVVMAAIADATDDPAGQIHRCVVALATQPEPDTLSQLPDDLWEAIILAASPYEPYTAETFWQRVDTLVTRFDQEDLVGALSAIVYDLIRDALGSVPDAQRLDEMATKVADTIDIWIAVDRRQMSTIISGLVLRHQLDISTRQLVEGELLACVALLAYYVDWTEPIRRTKEVSLAGSTGT